MYSAAVYNYFNTGRYAKKAKYRKRRIPIPKPSKTKQMSTCKSCGRKFLKTQSKRETDNSKNLKQTGNIVYEKVLLIWKYAKSFLSNTVHGNDNQKCSFKIITHKSYKKRSLQKEIVSTTVLSQIYCKSCMKRKNEKEHAEKYKIKEHVQNEHIRNVNKSDKKKKGKHGQQHNKIYCKKYRTQALSTTNESTEEIQSNESLRVKKRHINLYTSSSSSSLQKKRQGCNCMNNIINTRSLKKKAKQKIVKKKRNTKKTRLPKKKLKTNKQKQIFLKENKKKINRFASWQYMQHALNSIGEDNPSIYDTEDRTPVYLTFEEYCLILEAIDTPCNTGERYKSTGGELSIDVKEITENGRTEDVATNTDKPNEIIVDSSTNTEQLLQSTDINAKHLIETTETLDAINDPLSEAIKEFDTSIDQPTDTIISSSQDVNKTDNKSNKNSTQDTLDTLLGGLNGELDPNNSLVDINEIGPSENTVDPVLLSEEIEKLNEVGQSEEIYQTEEAKDQTESPEDDLDTTPNE